MSLWMYPLEGKCSSTSNSWRAYNLISELFSLRRAKSPQHTAQPHIPAARSSAPDARLDKPRHVKVDVFKHKGYDAQIVSSRLRNTADDLSQVHHVWVVQRLQDFDLPNGCARKLRTHQHRNMDESTYTTHASPCGRHLTLYTPHPPDYARGTASARRRRRWLCVSL